MLCGTGVTSQLLESRYSIAVPTSQLFVNYLLLGLVFGSLLAFRKDFLNVLRENWWKYLIVGVIDVEANYLVVLAYKYTTLTSIQVGLSSLPPSLLSLPPSLPPSHLPPAPGQRHHCVRHGSFLHLPPSTLSDHSLDGRGSRHDWNTLTHNGRYQWAKKLRRR